MRRLWKTRKKWRQQSKTEVRRIIFTLIAVVSFSAALAQWLHAQEGSSAFAPTLPNKTRAPGKAPEGMVWVHGGEVSMDASRKDHGMDRLPAVPDEALRFNCLRVQ